MSGVFGAVRFGTDTADTAAGTAMAATMRPWGDTPAARVQFGGAEFGHVLRAQTPEDAHSQMPRVVVERDLVATATARLDNRDELLAALGHRSPAEADSSILLRAYLAWGEDAFARLLGDWSFAAWHRDAQRLVLARDQTGITALCYHVDRAAGVVLFASDPRALIAAGVPARIDEVRLAATIVSWAGDDPQTTIHQDVRRIPPAHTLTVTADREYLTRFWFPPTDAAHGPQTSAAAGEGLLAVFDTATRSRLRSTTDVATTLSGGLDSGAVTALAARSLLAAGRSLAAYTSVPIADTTGTVGPERFGDETDLSTATATFAGVAEHHLLDSRRISPIQGIEASLAVHGQPIHAASNAFWLHDLLITAADNGHRTILTGQCGNATISWTGRSRRRTLRHAIGDRGLRGALSHLAPVAAHRRRTAHVLARDAFAHTAIEPTFAARIDLAERIGASLGSGNLSGPRASAIDQRVAILQPTATRIGDLWAANCAHAGVDVRDPTADVRVVDYTFTIPDRLFRGPAAIDRWVLRQAMTGLLPDPVRLNRSRGRQSADLVERLRISAAEVDAALDEVAGGPGEEYVSTDRLRAAWRAAQASTDALTTHRAGSVLLRGIMASMWVTRMHG